MVHLKYPVCNIYRLWEAATFWWLHFRFQCSSAHPPSPKLASERTQTKIFFAGSIKDAMVHFKYKSCGQATRLFHTS